MMPDAEEPEQEFARLMAERTLLQREVEAIPKAERGSFSSQQLHDRLFDLHARINALTPGRDKKA